jgi:proline iminopeptidase
MSMRASVTAFLLVAACSTAPRAVNSEQFVKSSDGVQLYYRSIGTGSPIVVIHGGPGMDHGSVANDLEPLARNHRVIFYDQRGGGRSTLPSDPSLLPIDKHVDDLESLRRHLGLEKLTLLGHSFGPAIAALYAIRYPQNVERMIFLGPIPPRKATFFEDYGNTLNARLTAAQLARMDELNSAFATAEDVVAVCREYWTLGTPPRLAKGMPVTIVKSDLCTAPPEALRYGMTKTNPTTFGSLGDWNWNPQLAAVKVPTLVIHGEEDAIPMALVREWSVVMPDARLLRLPATGHFPHAERPEVVFPAIEAFLDGRWPDGSVKEQ